MLLSNLKLCLAHDRSLILSPKFSGYMLFFLELCLLCNLFLSLLKKRITGYFLSCRCLIFKVLFSPSFSRVLCYYITLAHPLSSNFLNFFQSFFRSFHLFLKYSFPRSLLRFHKLLICSFKFLASFFTLARRSSRNNFYILPLFTPFVNTFFKFFQYFFSNFCFFLFLF